MDHDDQMTALRARIASAETERDTWRTAGMQEKFLESHSRVEALSLEYSDMHQARMRSLAASGAMQISEPEMVHEEERLMASLAICFDGRQYRYRDYRYDRLDDAIAYARLQRERGE